MLTIFTWLWGDKYSLNDVRKLNRGLRRNLKEAFRLVCVTPDVRGPQILRYRDDTGEASFHRSPTVSADYYLMEMPGCFVRLRMFDPEWQDNQGLQPGDRMVCIDLDVVVTGALDPLFHRPENFLILQGANASNPCPYNGSVWMLRAGYRPDVWSSFAIDEAKKIPFHEFPDDQGWMAAKIPDAAGWKAGSQSGIYAFQKPGWPAGDALPGDARLVVFPGWRSPAKFAHLPWVKENWR